jgi:hypothetical protein
MQSVHRFLSATALALVSASSFAATTVYTSSASFLSDVAAGSYTNTFDGLLSDPPTTFASGGFAYTISSPQGLYGSGDFLGVNQENEALTITFTSGNVKAVGANFFATDISDAFQAVSMTITLSDSTVVSFAPTSFSGSYRGFISDLAITSLVISSSGESLYSGLDNLTVGAVPEPTTWALMALGLAGIVAAGRRKA